MRRGLGYLSISKLVIAVLSVIRVARDAAVALTEDEVQASELRSQFKTLIVHFQSEAGETELRHKFDTSGDDEISEAEFASAFPRFVAELAGEAEDLEDPDIAEDADGEPSETVNKSKPSNKKAAADAKRREKLLKKDQLADSDEEEDGANGIPAPRGTRELFQYLAMGKSTARQLRDGPAGLAQTLQICVLKGMLPSMGVTLQNLMIGVELDGEDVANLLTLLSDTWGHGSEFSADSALKAYRRLTNVVWRSPAATGVEEAEGATTFENPATETTETTEIAASVTQADPDPEDFADRSDPMSPRGNHVMLYGPAKTLRRLACADKSITLSEQLEIYQIAKEILPPQWLGNAGLEGLFDGHWPTEAADEDASLPKATFVNPLEEDDVDEQEMFDGESALSGRIQGGGSTEQESEVNGGEEEDTDTLDPEPEMDGDQSDVSLQKVKIEYSAEELSPEAASALKKYAEEFEHDIVESVDRSLVRLIMAQSKNISTIAAFAQLVTPSTYPQEHQMNALKEFAMAATGVAPSVIDTLVWLWTGGDGTNSKILKKMLAPPQSTAVLEDAFQPGILNVTVVLATDLLDEGSLFARQHAYCAVIVEGHQRNTQTVKGTNPRWEANDHDAATFGFPVIDRQTAIVEIFVKNRHKRSTDEPLGHVTFPLHLIEPEKEFEQTFTITPTHLMNDDTIGHLGELKLRILFDELSSQELEAQAAVEAAAASEAEEHESKGFFSRLKDKAEDLAGEFLDLGGEKKVDEYRQLVESGAQLASPLALELIDTLKSGAVGEINAQVIGLIREASTITIARTKDRLSANISEPTNSDLQKQAMKEAGKTVEKGGIKVAKADLNYAEDSDQQQEMSYKIRRHDHKYEAAIAYCLSKCMGINPALLDLLGDTINKFAASPEAVGGFALSTLGTLGLQDEALPGVDRFLRDRLTDEMQKLVHAAKYDKSWYRQMGQVCRGKGCAAACVDRVSELIGEAGSFSTAVALMRLKEGLGAAEPHELTELDETMDDCEDKFIISGVQNLQRMIWPTREETFDKVKDLLRGNKEAQAALAGWESRAELALLCHGDETAARALNGLQDVEELRKYLVAKKRDLELIALKKLMRGNKAAMAVMKTLTPSLKDKIGIEWKRSSRFTKIKMMFAAGAGGFFLLMHAFKAIDGGGDVYDAILFVIDVIVLIVVGIGLAIAAAWWVMKGKNVRDKVVGPDPTGVELLRKISEATVDPDDRVDRMKCLDQMLSGVVPDDLTAKNFLKSSAQKYIEKVPEGMQAFECMEYMAILQQAGKSTAQIKEFDHVVPWPTWQEVWPVATYKLKEALTRVKDKSKSIIFKASVHPWMKKYAQHCGNQRELFKNVEIPLTMIKDNAEKFDALDKLNTLYRPDPAGLDPLVKVVEELVDLQNHGATPENLRQAIERQERTGNVKEVFASLDRDQTGVLHFEELEEATGVLAETLGFAIGHEELEAAYAEMDQDGTGSVSYENFQSWWKALTVDKKQAKIKAMEEMEKKGLSATAPRPKELQLLLKLITKMLPSIGVRPESFEVLEDLCPDDETFDCLQECFNLCELKRVMITDKLARNSIIGLEAMAMVPKLLEGNEKLGIERNDKAIDAMEQIKLGKQSALAALANIRQPEYKRIAGMLTQRQRRALVVLVLFVGLPVLVLSGVLDVSLDEILASIVDGFYIEECNATAGFPAGVDGACCNMSDFDRNFTVCPFQNDSYWTATGQLSDGGSWITIETETESAENATTSGSGYGSGADFSNPSFYILGLLPLISSLFVTLFGQRIASLITLATVFIASSATAIAAAFADGNNDFTPAKLLGVGAGVYSGSVALKVASGNIKFAYGVQGASIGATLCRFTTQIWRPMVLKLIPEVAPYLGWVDLTMAGAFGAAAAYISNQYRNIISVFATAAIGSLGTIQMMSAYNIPHMDKFTMGSLMSGQTFCGADDTGCWFAGSFSALSVYMGTLNQFHMQGMDFNMPAISVYDRVVHKINKVMTLLFALNEYIQNGAKNLDTADLMDRALKARDQMVEYANILTNLMHFSLCFGFAADFIQTYKLGIFSAAPWVGVCSLALAIVTPIQGTIGILSDIFTNKKFKFRVQEVKVPAKIRAVCSSRFPILGRESFIIEFGPIGAKLQKLTFYASMVNGFVNMVVVGVSYLTADSYAVSLKANWAELSADMPDLNLEDAMSAVTATVNGLGDSAIGLVGVLGGGIAAAAYKLGGMSWFLTHLVQMEKYMVLGAGSLIGMGGLKLSLDWPAGNYMFMPMQLCGYAVMFLGVVQAVPWFKKKFPDLIFQFHRAQLIVCGALGMMFVIIVTAAREVKDFVGQNWDKCHYEDACSILGQSDFSFSKYAADQNMSQEDVELYAQPLLYAASMSCLTSLTMVVGGSNLANLLYHRTVMSRKDEVAAMKNGESSSEARANALVKKVRRVREADINDVANRMQV